MGTLVYGFYTAAGVPLEQVLDREGDPGYVVTPVSDPKVCYYTHFDLTSEQLGRTTRYNCWAFTFLPRRYWLGRNDVDNLIRDNCHPVPDGSVEIGDIIRYKDEEGTTTHTGRVWQTDGAGHATLIRSKWGPSAEYIHHPLDPADFYGTDLAYFRQHSPLIGNQNETNKIADLWIKDSPGDDGNQYSDRPWWTSPDILVDAPPYDGNPDQNPVFNKVNRVYTVLRNRTNQRVDNVYVRFYWANPAVGLAPSNWNLIQGAVGPFSIDGNSSIDTDYVDWVPSTLTAHQCLLAIAYINDDPNDSTNPDPLVYSFDIPWDNNIAQRNVHVLEMENGSNSELSIQVGLPFDKEIELKGSLKTVLTYSPRLPILGFPRKATPLKTTIALDKERIIDLEHREVHKKFDEKFKLGHECYFEKPIAIMEIPNIVFTPKRQYKLNVNIFVPKEVQKGSIYYLHIMQSIFNKITGGYTVAIIIK